jgi:hydrogenase expression/formation protein HypE
LTEQLIDADIPAAVIGTMTDSNDRIIQNGEEIRYMDLPKPDQIRKLL